MPWRASAKAREKMPAEGPSARIGVAATVQEWPRSLEWKTRAAPGPPVANQASRLPNRVSEVLLAANEPSLGRAGGRAARGGRGGRRGSPVPGGAAVIGGEDLGAAVEWIARDNAVWRIPESDGVEEAFGIGVGEQERPVLAGVAGFIDAGFVAGAGTHQVDGARVDGADAAKIEGFGAGDFGGAPSPPAMGSREQGAAAAAGPYGAGVDRADTAQRGARITGLWRPGLRQEGSGETQRERQFHVFTMVSDCGGAAGGAVPP